MLAAFLVAFVFSFVGSMPIAGPIAVIVVGKGLDNQPRAGFFIAVGAALAESVYAGLAFLGITAILERYPVLIPVSRLAGCIILVVLGVYFLVRAPKAKAPDDKDQGKKATGAMRSVLLGLSVTAFNPTLLVSWSAAVSAAHSMGILRVHELDAFPFAGGVVLGIISWFATFLTLLGKFQKKMGPRSLDKVIKGMGVVLIVAGLVFGVRTVLHWHSGPDAIQNAKAHSR